MKNSHNNASLGLPTGGSSPDGPRADSAPSEIDITKDRLGEVLSSRRLQLGLRLEEIAEDIKIRVDYLRAIEQEAFDTLPTAEYSRLFLKSYAERLGLNVNDIYALYDVHHRPAWEPAKARATVPDTRQPIGPTPRLPAAKPIPTKFWMYLVIGILAIALVIFGVIKLLESGESSSSQSRIAPPPAVSESTTSDPAQTEQVVASTAEPASAADEIVIDAEMQLVLTFDRNTWINLVADNDTIASRVYRAGQTVQAKGLDRFVLSLGHTDGIQATVNGRQLKPFSTWTKGFDRMIITADSVAAWMLPATVTGGPVQ